MSCMMMIYDLFTAVLQFHLQLANTSSRYDAHDLHKDCVQIQVQTSGPVTNASFIPKLHDM